jgi:uncharacterized protein (DUF736 family)
MSNQDQNQKPMFRVSFSRITGKNDQGNDTLGKPREIGAAWKRTNGKKGAIVQLDIVPTDLANHNGVMFLVPVD